MSEQNKTTVPADGITKSSEENTVELVETELDKVSGGTDVKTEWKCQ